MGFTGHCVSNVLNTLAVLENRPCRWRCPCTHSPPAPPRTRAGSWTGSCRAQRACSPPGTRWLRCRCLCASSSAAGRHGQTKLTAAETSQMTGWRVGNTGSLPGLAMKDWQGINIVTSREVGTTSIQEFNHSLDSPVLHQLNNFNYCVFYLSFLI